MIIDITRTLGADCVCYPGDPEFAREEVRGTAGAVGFTIARLALGSHSGTHLDAPRHLFESGATLDSLPPERFILPAVVVSCGMAEQVQPAHLDGITIPQGGAVLFRTSNSFLERDALSPEWVSIHPDTARLLVKQGVSLVGVDYISPDPADSEDLPTHRILLGAGVLILEDVGLSAAEPGEYRLTCLPLRVKDADAAPCRAVLERR